MFFIFKNIYFSLAFSNCFLRFNCYFHRGNSVSGHKNLTKNQYPLFHDIIQKPINQVWKNTVVGFNLLISYPFFIHGCIFFMLQRKVRLLYTNVLFQQISIEHFIFSSKFSSLFRDVVHAKPHK